MTRPTPIRVVATREEIALAHRERDLRVRRHDIRFLEDKFAPEDRDRIDLYESLAEILFARDRHIPWHLSEGPRRQSQLDPWRVRWTDELDGHLLVAPTEPAHQIHVLVIGPVDEWEFTLDIVGHMLAEDAKRRPLWRHIPRHAHAVPQDDLKGFAPKPGAAS